jgi:hypothetical protein
MAFQTGTQVRPELGRADVSGFARAGMITGQALANLGRDIGEGMEKYQKNKMITSTALASLEGTTAKNPEIITLAKEAGGDVAKAFKAIESGDYRMRDALTAQGFAASYQEQKILEQESRLREAQLAKLKMGKTQAELDKEAAELARTQAMTEKTKAETAALGKPKPLTQSERMRLIESKVGDVTFGQYLQELKQTKKIKGGKLHQRGLLNFDEDQIAAFDDAILNNPEFLRDMPQAVKDYYSSMGSKPMVMTLGDGTIAEVNPQ